MNGDDMQIIASSVIADGHVKGPVRLYRRHQQALREGSGPRPLFNDLTVVDDLEGLLPGDAALVGPEQRMVPPLDTTGPRCCSNAGKFEHSAREEVMDRKPQSV